jgi:flagellar hook-length control protein FliK
MQLPFAKLLGLASGAVGLVQKAFTHNSGKGHFDAELKTALTEKAVPGKSGIMNMLMKKGVLDEDVLKGLLDCPTAAMLFQFMTELKEMGINPKDMGFLLSGNASKVSDDALRSLLASSGIDADKLEEIMSDINMKTQIKTSLAEAFKTSLGALNAQAGEDGLDLEALVRVAAADTKTVGKVAETLSSSQAAATIREMVANALKKIEKPLDVVLSEDSARNGKIQSMQKMIMTAEKSLGIDRDVLKNLFFSTDKFTRDEAVAQATRQVNAYLAAQTDKTVKADIIDTLSLLKSAMSEQEFSGIENSLKLWKPDLAISEMKTAFDRNILTALARQLGSDEPAVLFNRQINQVMEQLRRALPSYMKNSEGRVTLKLHPPMLGRVDVNMIMNDGQLQAVFKTDQALTRDIILQNMQMLKDALAEQGIRATNFSVTTVLDGKSSGDGYAFAGGERQDHGLNRHGSRSGSPGRAFRDRDELVYSQNSSQGVADSGGLDIFA